MRERHIRRAARASAGAAAILGLVACTGGTGDSGGGGGGGAGTGLVVGAIGAGVLLGSDDDRTSRNILVAVSLAVAIAKKLEKVAQDCEALGRAEYQIDCLGEGYGRVSQDIPRDSTFAEARAAVARAAAELSGLAAANRAAALPELEAGKRTRPLRPVDPAVLAAARARAAEIVEETETVLLRSSEADYRKQQPYQKIAAALESSKVLLRS